MRSRPGWNWVAFNTAKYHQYPKGTRENKLFNTAAPVVPYGLPELQKALAANQTILIPEGEKKVERIRELGFPATCNAGGAKKWAPEHTAYLKGADVVLLPDSDPVGIEHVEAIAKTLSTVANRVRILNLPNLPPKGDIVDWRGTAEEFALLVEAAEDYIPDQRDKPQPLIRPLPPPEPFPIEALAQVLLMQRVASPTLFRHRSK
jgi:DNA primase